MKKSPNELVSNRKARHNYEISETYEAGIVLLGTEIKSLRNHGGSLDEAYIIHSGGALVLKNAFIKHYDFGNLHNHEEKRERKLLMHKREILKLKQISDQKGLTLVPLSIYLKNGIAKVKLGVGKGKKSHDKRDALKKAAAKRDIDKAMRDNS